MICSHGHEPMSGSWRRSSSRSRSWWWSTVSSVRVCLQWRTDGSSGFKVGGHSPECLRYFSGSIHAAFFPAGAAFAVVGADSHDAV